MIGFERAQYTVREDYGTLEVCVRVSNPPHNRALSIDINVDYSCSPGLASEYAQWQYYYNCHSK